MTRTLTFTEQELRAIVTEQLTSGDTREWIAASETADQRTLDECIQSGVDAMMAALLESQEVKATR